MLSLYYSWLDWLKCILKGRNLALISPVDCFIAEHILAKHATYLSVFQIFNSTQNWRKSCNESIVVKLEVITPFPRQFLFFRQFCSFIISYLRWLTSPTARKLQKVYNFLCLCCPKIQWKFAVGNSNFLVWDKTPENIGSQKKLTIDIYWQAPKNLRAKTIWVAAEIPQAQLLYLILIPFHPFLLVGFFVG